MKRLLLVVMLASGSAASAAACDGVVAVAPSAFVGGQVFAPTAVTVVPSVVVTPLVQVDAYAAPVALANAQVLAASVAVRSCAAARVRIFPRAARPRVTVRVR